MEAGPTRGGGETSLLGVRLNSRCFSWRALEVHGALPSPAEKEKTREQAPHHCRGRWEAVGGLPWAPSRSWGWAEVSPASCTTTHGPRGHGAWPPLLPPSQGSCSREAVLSV